MKRLLFIVIFGIFALFGGAISIQAAEIVCTEIGNSPNKELDCGYVGDTAADFTCSQQVNNEVCSEGNYFIGYPACRDSAWLLANSVAGTCSVAENEYYDCQTNTCTCLDGYSRDESGNCSNAGSYLLVSPNEAQVSPTSSAISVQTPAGVSLNLTDDGLQVNGGNTGANAAEFLGGAVVFEGELSLSSPLRTTSTICIDNDCRSSWPSSGGGADSDWNISGDDVYYNDVGGVGIGTDAPLLAFVVTSGEVAIGFNEADQESLLSVNGPVSIGIDDPIENPFGNDAYLSVQNGIDQSSGLHINMLGANAVGLQVESTGIAAYFETGTVQVNDDFSAFDNVILGNDVLADTLTINAVIQNQIPLVFEGLTVDDFQTDFVITDPTADRTFTFPDKSGTIATLDDVSGAWTEGGDALFFNTGVVSVGGNVVPTYIDNGDGSETDLIVTDDLEVLDNGHIGNDFIVGSATSNIETIDAAGFILSGDDLFVAGSTGVEGDIYVDGNLDLQGELEIDGGTISKTTGTALNIVLGGAATDYLNIDGGNILIDSANDNMAIGPGIHTDARRLEVFGDNITGIYVDTDTAGEDAIYAIGWEDNTNAIETLSLGNNSYGVYASTAGTVSYSIYGDAAGDNSTGVYAGATGANGVGLYAYSDQYNAITAVTAADVAAGTFAGSGNIGALSGKFTGGFVEIGNGGGIGLPDGQGDLYVQDVLEVDGSVYLGDGADVLCLNGAGCAHPIHAGTDGTNGNGAHLTAGGTWTNGSSRTFKDRYQDLDSQDVYEKVIGLEIQGWYYKDTNEYHIGPFAEDFYELFATGESNMYLSPADMAGVALISVQELDKKYTDLVKRIEELEQQLQELQ